MNLPNKLTIARIFAIPLIIIVSLIPIFSEKIVFGPVGSKITLENLLILIIFALASFTDFLDGYLARKHNLITDFGKFMDPLADKLLVLTALIYLLERGRFQAFGFNLGFVITIILAREFMVTGIRLLALDNKLVIAASKLGKAKTVTQMLTIILLLVNKYPFTLLGDLAGEIAGLVMISLAGVLTLVSGIDYFVKNKEIILRSK
ncbi:MAG TPA: CDP-diacylglycerol--glycerol-3-phosphate 3-phosphatidyltransferase [Acholeplasmataceae bacterium]|jgi:CDP-diacylglycerol--glycerol-3-phosphate 3-phosphatidyltransferase|nr:CDP-diacylglycerol--glycerol-3-phosphate 3-phosphatidyltransferase [Acholeplasmataceae bacterium]